MKRNHLDNLDLYLGILLIATSMQYKYFYLPIAGITLIAGQTIRKITRRNINVSVWTPFVLQVGVVIGHLTLIVLSGRVSMLIDAFIILAAAILFFVKPSISTAVINIIVLIAEIVPQFMGLRSDVSTMAQRSIFFQLFIAYALGAAKLMYYLVSRYKFSKDVNSDQPNKAL